MENLFVFGMGYSARLIAAALAAETGMLFGTHRKAPEHASSLGYTALKFDGERPADPFIEALNLADRLLISIAPPAQGDLVLAALESDLEKAVSSGRLRWIGYLSTVGVYGNHDGAWVGEDTQCKPVSKRSIQRLEAERAWQHFADRTRVPLGIFRLSGIYGPGRNAFVKLTAGKAKRIVKPGQVFNRIHVDDIATAVASAAQSSVDGLFNITDSEPAPPQDVIAYAANLMGIEPPPEIPFETADMTPMARSFYGENKRVSNAKAKRDLGWMPLYPDYRSALDAMWSDGTWKDAG